MDVEVEAEADVEVPVNGATVHSTVHIKHVHPEPDAIAITPATVEPTTQTEHIEEPSGNGEMDGKQDEVNTKITTANITISSAMPGSMQSDEAGREVCLSSESLANGQQVLPGGSSGHHKGAGGVIATSRMGDPLDRSETAPQQHHQNGQHSWEAELSFALSSNGDGAVTVATATAEQQAYHVSGSSGHQEPQFEGGEIENEPEVRQDVVRESDRRDGEELPEQGLAQSLVSRFKDIESEAQHTKQKEHRPSGVAVKATPTPLRPAPRQAPEDGVDSGRGADIARLQERSEVENEPIVRTDVVKESDTNVAEELPERGMARNLLSKFKTMEVEAQQRSEYKPSGASVRAAADVHPTWKGISGQSPSAVAHREPTFEGGDVENTPQVRTDVVRESDSTGEELPERGLAQSLLSRFKSLESEATKKPEYKPSGVAHKATPSKMHIMAGRSVYVPDGTTKAGPTGGADAGAGSAVHEPQFEGGEFENTPEVRADVVKEGDRVQDEDLPQQGLAKNLLSRFKSIEAEASVQKDYVPSGVGSKPTPTPLGLASTAVGRRPVPSLHEGSVDSRGSSAERDLASATYDSPPVADGGEYESAPAPRPEGVVSASDHTDLDDLPESGLAQSVLSKFKSLESQRAADYQPSGVASKAVDAPVVLRRASGPEHDLDAGVTSDEALDGYPDEVCRSNVGHLDKLSGADSPEQPHFDNGTTQPLNAEARSSDPRPVTHDFHPSAESLPGIADATEDSSDCSAAACLLLPAILADCCSSSNSSTTATTTAACQTGLFALRLPPSVFSADGSARSPPEDSLHVIPSSRLEFSVRLPSPSGALPMPDLPSPTDRTTQLFVNGSSRSRSQTCMAPQPCLTTAMPAFCPHDVQGPTPGSIADDPGHCDIMIASGALQLSLKMEDGGVQSQAHDSKFEPYSLDGDRGSRGVDVRSESTGSVSPALSASSLYPRATESSYPGCRDYLVSSSSQLAGSPSEGGSAMAVPSDHESPSDLSSDCWQLSTSAGATCAGTDTSSIDKCDSTAGEHLVTCTPTELSMLHGKSSLITACRELQPAIETDSKQGSLRADETVGHAAKNSMQTCAPVCTDVPADMGCSCCAQHGDAICPGLIMDVLMYGSKAYGMCTRCGVIANGSLQQLHNSGLYVPENTEISKHSMNLTFSNEDSMVALGDDECSSPSASTAFATEQKLQLCANVHESEDSDIYSKELQSEKGVSPLGDVAHPVICTGLADAHDTSGQVLQIEKPSECLNLPITELHSCQPGDGMLNPASADTSLSIIEWPSLKVCSHDNPKATTNDSKVHVIPEAAYLDTPPAETIHRIDRSRLAGLPVAPYLVFQLQAATGNVSDATVKNNVEVEPVPASLAEQSQLCSNASSLQTVSSDKGVAKEGSHSPDETAVLSSALPEFIMELDETSSVNGALSLGNWHSKVSLVDETPSTDESIVTLLVVPDETGKQAANSDDMSRIGFDRPGTEEVIPRASAAVCITAEIDGATSLPLHGEGIQTDDSFVLTSSGRQCAENVSGPLVDGHRMEHGLNLTTADNMVSQLDPVLSGDLASAASPINGIDDRSYRPTSICCSLPGTPVNSEDDPTPGQSSQAGKCEDAHSFPLHTELMPEVAKLLVTVGTCLMDDRKCSCREEESTDAPTLEQKSSNTFESEQSHSQYSQQGLDKSSIHHEAPAPSPCTKHCGGSNRSPSDVAVIMELMGQATHLECDCYSRPTTQSLRAIVSTAEHVATNTGPVDSSFESLGVSHPHGPATLAAEGPSVSLEGALRLPQPEKSNNSLHNLSLFVNDAEVTASGHVSDPARSLSTAGILLTGSKEVGICGTDRETALNRFQDRSVPMQGTDSVEKQGDHECGTFPEAATLSTIGLSQVLDSVNKTGGKDSVAPIVASMDSKNCEDRPTSLEVVVNKQLSGHLPLNPQTEMLQLYDGLTDCGTMPDLATTSHATTTLQHGIEFASVTVSFTMAVNQQLSSGDGVKCHQASQLPDTAHAVTADPDTSDDTSANCYMKNMGWLCTAGDASNASATDEDLLSTGRSGSTSIVPGLPDTVTHPSACLMQQDEFFIEPAPFLVLSLSGQLATNVCDEITSPSCCKGTEAALDVPKKAGLQLGDATAHVEGANAASFALVQHAGATNDITMAKSSINIAAAIPTGEELLSNAVQVQGSNIILAPTLCPPVTGTGDCIESLQHRPTHANYVSSSSADPLAGSMSGSGSLVRGQALGDIAFDEVTVVGGLSDRPSPADSPVALTLEAKMSQKDLVTPSIDQMFDQNSGLDVCSSATTDHLYADSALAVFVGDINPAICSRDLRDDLRDSADLRQQSSGMSETDLSCTSANLQESATAALSEDEPISAYFTQGIISQQQVQLPICTSSVLPPTKQEANDRIIPIDSFTSANKLAVGDLPVSSGEAIAQCIGVHLDANASSVDHVGSQASCDNSQMVKRCPASVDKPAVVAHMQALDATETTTSIVGMC